MPFRDPVHNVPYLTHIRRKLRSGNTEAEERLWFALKHSRLDGWKFRRQHGIVHYVLDFYCFPLRLGVEIDGGYHFTPEQQKRDQERQQNIEALGIQVVRFTNERVVEDRDGVLQDLRVLCRERGLRLGVEPKPKLERHDRFRF